MRINRIIHWNEGLRYQKYSPVIQAEGREDEQFLES